MAIQTTLFNDGPIVLLGQSWVDKPFAAVLLSSAYVPSLEHEVYSDLSQFAMSEPLAITSKAIERVGSLITLTCDDFNFADQGTLNAKYMVVVAYDGTLQPWNKLVCYLDLNTEENVDIAVTPEIQIDGEVGLIQVELING